MVGAKSPYPSSESTALKTLTVYGLMLPLKRMTFKTLPVLTNRKLCFFLYGNLAVPFSLPELSILLLLHIHIGALLLVTPKNFALKRAIVAVR